MKNFLARAVAFAALSTATPALAQDTHEEVAREMEEGLDTLLNDPTLPDRMAAMAVALAAAMEAMPVGQIEAAMEGRTPTEEEAARRLGDEMEIDREQLADGTRDAMVANREQMQGAARALALMLPVLADTAEQMADAVEHAGVRDR